MTVKSQNANPSAAPAAPEPRSKSPREVATCDKVPTPSVLRDTVLFQGLPDDDLVAISRLMHSSILPPSVDILTVKKPSELVFVLIRGTVKIYLHQADGADVILGILGAGEVLGEVSSVDGKTPSANVMTLEESHFLCIERPLLWQSMQTMPILGYNVAQILARRLRLATSQIQSYATLDAYGRVARQLLAFAQEYGRKTKNGDVLIPMHLTQTDLADLIGASRVRVNRVIMDFKNQKHISVDANHRITIHNFAALRERCRSLA